MIRKGRPAMPETHVVQQHRAAKKSAQVRHYRRLLRELRNANPLTEAQRSDLIAAAAAIPTGDPYPSTGGAA